MVRAARLHHINDQVKSDSLGQFFSATGFFSGKFSKANMTCFQRKRHSTRLNPAYSGIACLQLGKADLAWTIKEYSPFCSRKLVVCTQQVLFPRVQHALFPNLLRHWLSSVNVAG